MIASNNDTSATGNPNMSVQVTSNTASSTDAFSN